MTLYLLNLADLISTLLAISHGLVERNPVVNFMLHTHPMIYPVVKLIPAYYLCDWLAQNARANRPARKRYAAIVCIYAAVVVWNILNIAAVAA